MKEFCQPAGHTQQNIKNKILKVETINHQASLILVHLASKLFNCLRHSESLKNTKESTSRHFGRKISPISSS